MLPITGRQGNARLTQVDKQITEINTESSHFNQSDDTLARSMKILLSIPGIGAVCASTVVSEMSKVGTMDRKQMAIHLVYHP